MRIKCVSMLSPDNFFLIFKMREMLDSQYTAVVWQTFWGDPTLTPERKLRTSKDYTEVQFGETIHWGVTYDSKAAASPHPTPSHLTPAQGKTHKSRNAGALCRACRPLNTGNIPSFCSSTGQSQSDHWLPIGQCRNPGDSNRVLSYKTCGHLLPFVYPSWSSGEPPSPPGVNVSILGKLPYKKQWR